jgi:hypothetical protein
VFFNIFGGVISMIFFYQKYIYFLSFLSSLSFVNLLEEQVTDHLAGQPSLQDGGFQSAGTRSAGRSAYLPSWFSSAVRSSCLLSCYQVTEQLTFQLGWYQLNKQPSIWAGTSSASRLTCQCQLIKQAKLPAQLVPAHQEG